MKCIKGSAVIAVLTMTVVLGGCTNSEAGNASSEPVTEPHRVIIDSDTGADDAMALLMAAKSDNITIEGVTVAAGNVDIDQAAKNALMTLEVAGCDAPVYKGAEATFTGVEREIYSVFGEDGMGDVGLVHPSREAEDGDAVDFILDTVKNNPGEIEIMAIGPVTNIANAIEKDPETMAKVKCIWSMGSAGFGPGNATPVAEFNVYMDAEAYDVMLKSGIPINIIGLDMCQEESVLLPGSELEKMKEGTEVQKYCAEAFDKLLEYSKATQNRDDVEICDAIAMAALIWSDYITDYSEGSAVCVTDSETAYGEVIFYDVDKAYVYMQEATENQVRIAKAQKGDELLERINEIFEK